MNKVKNILTKAIAIVALAAFIWAFLFHAVMNTCGACGAVTLDRYPICNTQGEFVYVCPLCADAAR